ncbi:hypothetical protein L13192_08004 [Pyrenophora tritici-repentis]|nr:hypothetical protein L13192_08004 [Pyrenophora tritici-repentis]
MYSLALLSTILVAVFAAIVESSVFNHIFKFSIPAPSNVPEPV